MVESTIEWEIDGQPSSVVEDYLSCDEECASTVLSPTSAAIPSFVLIARGEPDPSCTNNIGPTPVEVIVKIEVNVVTKDALIASIDPASSTVCIGNTRIIKAAPAGGVAPYTYLWNTMPTQTTQSISVGAGSYQVTVRDTFTRCAPVLVSTTVTSVATPAAPTVSTPVEYCVGLPATALTATGTNLLWYTSETGIGSATAPIPSTASSGSTSYWVSQTVSGCESQKSKITVNVYDYPNFTVNAQSASSCGGTGSITLSGLLPSTSYIFSYLKDNITNTTLASITNSIGSISFGNLTNGNYSSISVSKSSCQVVNPNTFTISNPAALNPTISVVNSTNCASPNGSLSFSNLSPSTSYGVSYTVNNGPLISVSVSSNSSGVLTLANLGAGAYGNISILNSANNCSFSTTALYGITAPSVPSFTISSTNPVNCNNPTGTISLGGLLASTQYAISYTFNGNPVAAANYTTNSSGVYTLLGLQSGTYTNITLSLNSCSTTSTQTISLVAPSSPVILSSNAAMCADGVSTKSLSSSPSSGSWSLGASSTSNVGTVLGTTFTVGSVGGTAIVVFTGNNGCSASMSFVVNALPNITVSTANASTCGGLGLVNIAISNPAGNYDIDLNGDGVYDFTNRPNNAGNIQLSAPVGTVVNNTRVRSVSTACVSNAFAINTTIAQPANPTNSTSTVGMCADSISTRALTGSPVGGSWSFGVGSTNLIGSITGASFRVAKISGTAIITYTVSGCSSSVSIPVSVPPTVVVNNPASVCAPATVNLTAATVTAGSTAGLTYSYFTNAAGTLVLSNPSAVSTSGTYYIRGTNSNGCSDIKPVVVNISNAVNANAGNNQSICGSSVSLSGGATSGASTFWSASVAGTFNPNNTSLNTTFTPSIIPSSSITITLNASIGSCNATPSSINVVFEAKPSVVAGADQNVCSNINTINLTGSASPNNTPVLWTSNGTGSFLNSSSNSLSATYSPSNADKTNGLRFILSSTNVSCNNSDTVFVNFSPTPTINAGSNRTVCSADKSITMSPAISPSNTPVLWTSIGTGVWSNPNTANARYTFSAQDSANGSVTLTVASQNSGNCNSNGSVVVTINQSPFVNVLPTYEMCSFTPSFDIVRGTVTPEATPVQWTVSGGTGTFANPNAVNTSYNASVADRQNVTNPIYMILQANAANGCVSRDTSVLRYRASAVPLAGNNRTVCANVNSVAIAGSVFPSNARVQWTTSGSGSFVNNTLAAPTYIPSASDRSSSGVTLSISTLDFGTCNLTRTMNLAFTPVPQIDAGPEEITVCRTTRAINVSGTRSPSNTPIRWSTNGTGEFDSETSINTEYEFTNNDRNNANLYLTLRSTNSSCNARDSIKINFANAPTVVAGSNVTRCTNNANLQLNGTVSGITNTGVWTSTGSGQFVTSSSLLNATYVPSENDKSTGSTGITLTLTSTNNGNCPAVSRSFNLSFSTAPVVSVGSDRSICANAKSINLNGSVSGATSTGTWSTSGNGTFSSSTSMTPVYTLGSQDSVAGSVVITLTSTNNGACTAVSNSFTLNVAPSPTVNAGNNQSICDNLTVFSLSGTVSGSSTTGIWSSQGSGTFGSNTSLQTTYSPSNADKTNGSVLLKLTSTNNGICNPVSDEVLINFTPSPTVNAGEDITVCANTSNVTISGSVSGITSTGSWRSLSATPGTFANSNSTSTTYTPSTSERSSGSAILILSSTNNGSCNQASDQLTILFSPTPVVSAGSNQTVCANVDEINLLGSVTGSTSTGVWSSNGTGTFSPSANALNAQYIPSNADKSLSTIDVSLTSTNNGSCNAVSDTKTITLTVAPTAQAGTNITVCANNADIGLNGVVTGATGGVWSSNGTGVFNPNVNNLRATYIPGALELSSGSVTLTLTTTGNGNCNSSSSSFTIRINPAPKADAGEDKVVCKNDPSIQLNGKVTTSTGNTNGTGNWRTLGTGTVQNISNLNTSYTPSEADKANGVKLILFSTNNSNCVPAIDTIQITFSDVPVNAGSDLSTCTGNPPVTLGGTVSGANSTGLWSSSGTGTFNPSNQYSSASGASRITYTPSEADKSNPDPIILTLTATSSNVNCTGAMSSSIALTILKSPSVSVEPNKTVCSNSNLIPISGTVTGNASGALWTVARGSGSFSPSNSSLNTNYAPSSEDFESGLVRLRLTSVGNGACLASTNVLVINFEKEPVVSAGVNTSLCSNQDTLSLNGIVSNYSGTSIWSSSGSGVFLPNANDLKAKYLPSVADKNAAKVTLSLKTNSDGVCNQVSNGFDITFLQAPTISAGKDTVVCSNANNIRLGAIVSDLIPVLWTSSGKGVFSSPNVLNPLYTFTQEDFQQNSISFTVSTNSVTNSCPASRSTINVTFVPNPIANAGKDTSVCENNGVVALKGNVQNATGGSWASSGTGVFSNKDLLVTNYIPSPADYLTGTVSLTLSAKGNQNCQASSDELILSFKKSAKLDAGLDFNVCQGDTILNLSGTLTGSTSTGFLWKSLGTGSFVLPSTSLNTTYRPSQNDGDAKIVTFVLSYTNTSECAVLNDTVVANFTPLATVNAGNDITICANQPILLNGSLTEGATKVRWSSTGSGTFRPTANQLSVIYEPTITDLQLGVLDITLTATDACAPVSDKLQLSLTPTPLVEAGFDIEICEGNNKLTINGFITEGGLIKGWTSNGDGFFANASALETEYTLGANDIANKKIKLVLSSEQSGNCPGGNDTLNILILTKPIVDAGNNLIACSNGLVDLKGSILGGNGNIKWTSNGAGQFLPSDTVLLASYKPSPLDIQSGNVLIFLSSTNTSGCPNSIDSLSLTISKSISEGFNAGLDKKLCAGAITQIGNTATEGFKYRWSPSIGVSDTNSSNPIIKIEQSPLADTVYTYVVSATDIQSNCMVKDTVLISLSPKPKPVEILNNAVLCGEPQFGLVYNVVGLANSKYTWAIKNGEITSGINTSIVVVNWNEGFDASLTVIEESDKGCTSDELKITLSLDRAGMTIKNVSNTLPQSAGLIINWSYASLSNIPKSITLFRRKIFPTTDNFSPIKSFTGIDSTYTDLNIDTGAVYEYKFRFSNSCDKIIETTVHNNILMKIVGLQESTASLSWNPYKGWVGGVQSYEVWRKTDADYELIANVDSSTTSLNLIDTRFANQCYHIKAVPRQRGQVSISNEYCEVLQFSFKIPNAFSPNGDNINDLWLIENIELFKNNEVKVFNQWNSEVYSKKNYNNITAWDGEGLPDGTYYYQIKTKDKSYNGYLLIVR
jgi:gliding motility-associated-like protein